MHSESLAVDLSPDPLLGAIDGYRGTIYDLDRGCAVTASEFHRAQHALASRIRDLGLGEGDRVVVALANGPQFIAMLGAVLRCGGSPILAHVLTPPAELKRTALRFGARFVTCDAWTEADMADVSIAVSPVSETGWLQALWSTIDETDPAFIDSYPALPGVPLHQTSGTTGVPKVAIRPGATAVAEATHYIDTIGIDESDSVIVVSPMSHAYAYGMGVMVPMLSGADIVSMQKFQSRLAFGAFAESLATIFPAVPAMLDVMLFGAGDRLKNSPRKVFAAGAPLPERVARTYREKSGTLVRPLYGTTETGGISVGVEDRDALITGCVGTPMNGVCIEARSSESSASENAEHLQTLYVRSTSMMAGYLSPTGIDRSPLVDEWFQTGDLSRIDEHNAIHLRGRITEVINVGGMKVVPSEVAEVITSFPGVLEAKVYAGSSPSGTQFVKAAVVAQGVDSAEIRTYCAEQLIYYKRPSAVLMVDALPKTPSGKVILSELP